MPAVMDYRCANCSRPTASNLFRDQDGRTLCRSCYGPVTTALGVLAFILILALAVFSALVPITP